MKIKKMLFLVKTLFWLMQEVVLYLSKILKYQYYLLKIMALALTFNF